MTRQRPQSNLALLAAVTSAVYLFAARNVLAKPPATSGAERFVTGDAERIGSVAAIVPAGVVVSLVPIADTGNYPDGYSISGNHLLVSGGGFTSVWLTKMEGWENAPGHPQLRAFQDQIDVNGFRGATATPPYPGCDLPYPPDVSCTKTCASGSLYGHPCSSDLDCQGSLCKDSCKSTLIYEGSHCGTLAPGVCDWAYENPFDTGGIFQGIPQNQYVISVDVTNPAGPIFSGSTQPGFEVASSTEHHNVGTLLISVPLCCRGTYTIGHVASATFAKDQAQPSNSIPIIQFSSGQLECQTGACCTTGSNVPCGAICTEGISKAECDAMPSRDDRHNFRVNVLCSDCVGCCDDCDACTVEGCGVPCIHTPKPGWAPGGSTCCDSITGELTHLILGNSGCLIPNCSEPNSHGTVVMTPAPAGTPCSSGSSCILNEQCDNSGNCVGTHLPQGADCAYPTLGSDPCIGSAACDAQSRCIPAEYLGPECLKNRYITFSPIDVGGVSALRVTLDSLQHPQPPNLPQVPPPNFSAFEGQIRWVGQVNDCEETESPPTSFKCAYLQCTPVYANWTALLNGQWLHLMGPEIMPSSLYTIDQLNVSCQGNEQNCSDVAATTQVETARNGDCFPPYQDRTTGAPLTQPNISDVSAIVDKFKGVPTAISRTRAQLVPSTIGINQRVSITDVATDIDAFINLPYYQAGPRNCP
ncbi:MAG: hypothetical protein HY287_05915 [Planctomycetes bacterium]|nr:hypothetical protein [Planctomycetota bacterium]MBI3833848.1 hypothetical protein [Planctomycetota bacterium]